MSRKRQSKITRFITQSSKENEGTSAAPKSSAFSVSSQNKSNRSCTASQSTPKNVFSTMGKETDGCKVKPELGNVKHEDDQVIGFKFSGHGIDGEHIARGKANETIYSTLMSMPIVQEINNKNPKKEIHLLNRYGKTSFINLGMPLKCLEKESHFEMLFYPFVRNVADHTDGDGDGDGGIKERYRRDDAALNEYVKFYVLARVGKGNEKIVHSNKLHQSRYPLCVFAAQGESFSTALCKDERFLPKLEKMAYTMVAKNKEMHYPDLPVDNFSNVTFSVEFRRQSKKKESHAAGDQTLQHSCLSIERNLQCFEQSLLDQYPCLSQQGTLIEDALKAEAEHQSKTPQKFLEHEKEEFGKKTINSTTVRVQKILIRRSRSVGYIEWDNNGNRGSASCFLFAGCYIVTCHHVIRGIVGEGVEERYWPEIISKSAKVTFTYEKKHPNEGGYHYVACWLECSEKTLDYALLKLLTPSHPFPRGLMRYMAKQPHNGLVYIIGHPDRQEKTTDACTVLPFIQRFAEMRHRLHEEQKKDCNAANCTFEADECCVHMFSPSSLQNIRTPRTLTYDTSFFHGSSGSPVFDASGQLVAMHSAGYSYKLKLKKYSVIEFGWALKEICSDIKSKNKEFYDVLLKEEGMSDDETIEGDARNEESSEGDMSNDETTEDEMNDEETNEVNENMEVE